MGNTERGLNPKQAETKMQNNRACVLHEKKIAEELRIIQERAKTSRQLLQQAIKTIEQFPQETIFTLTDSTEGEEIIEYVSICYPSKESKKGFVDQNGRIKIQDPDGNHKRYIGLINFITKTGINNKPQTEI